MTLREIRKAALKMKKGQRRSFKVGRPPKHNLLINLAIGLDLEKNDNGLRYNVTLYGKSVRVHCY